MGLRVKQRRSGKLKLAPHCLQPSPHITVQVEYPLEPGTDELLCVCLAERLRRTVNLRVGREREAKSSPEKIYPLKPLSMARREEGLDSIRTHLYTAPVSEGEKLMFGHSSQPSAT